MSSQCNLSLLIFNSTVVGLSFKFKNAVFLPQNQSCRSKNNRHPQKALLRRDTHIVLKFQVPTPNQMPLGATQPLGSVLHGGVFYKTIAYYDVIQVGASLNTNNLSYQVSLQSNMKKLSYLANKLKF